MTENKNGNSDQPTLPVRKIERMRSRKKKVAASGRAHVNIKELRTPLRQAMGKRIERAVKEAELTGEEAAKRIGVTYTTYRKYCRGDSEIDLETLELLAEATGKLAHWFYGSGDPGPDIADVLAYAVFNIVRELREGGNPMAVFDRAIAPATISPSFRRVIEEHLESLKTPRLLSPEGHRALAERIEALADTPPSPGGGG